MPTQQKTSKKHVRVEDALDKLFKDCRASGHGRKFEVRDGATGLRDLAQQVYGHTFSQYSDRQLAYGISQLAKHGAVRNESTKVREVILWEITLSEG